MDAFIEPLHIGDMSPVSTGDNATGWRIIQCIKIIHSKSLSAHPLKLLNQLAVIYANAGEPLTALSFLEEAISIHETDQTTIATMYQNNTWGGQPGHLCMAYPRYPRGFYRTVSASGSRRY